MEKSMSFDIQALKQADCIFGYSAIHAESYKFRFNKSFRIVIYNQVIDLRLQFRRNVEFYGNVPDRRSYVLFCHLLDLNIANQLSNIFLRVNGNIRLACKLIVSASKGVPYNMDSML